MKKREFLGPCCKHFAGPDSRSYFAHSDQITPIYQIPVCDGLSVFIQSVAVWACLLALGI
jgi:hypothetical protein